MRIGGITMKWWDRLCRLIAGFDSNDDPEQVRLYDFDRQEVVRVPLRDLPAGWIKVHVEGIDGLVWVDPGRLKPNEHQHPPFERDVLELIEEIKLALDEVYPRSLEEWEDGFRRDRNPSREIAMWLRIAQVYKALTAARPLSLAAKQDYLKVLLACTMGPREEVLRGLRLSELSPQDAQQAIDAFFDPNTPPD